MFPENFKFLSFSVPHFSKYFFNKRSDRKKSVRTSPLICLMDLVSDLIRFLTLRANLKNLSRGLNLSRGSNMVGSTYSFIQFFKIQDGAQLKPVFGGYETRFKIHSIRTLDPYYKKYFLLQKCGNILLHF